MMKRWIALGFFDGVHLGHLRLLAQTRAMADACGAAACAVTFDRSPGKGSLLTTLPDRIRLLKSLGRMDEVLVLPFDEKLMHTPWQDFAAALADTHGAAGLVCGSDYRFGAQAAGTADALQQFCAARGIDCRVVAPVKADGETVSSTRIRSLVADGDMERAARLYGHRHTLSGTVVTGQHLGSRLGFPTANLQPPQGLLLPKFGVYAVHGTVDGTAYTGVCNVGCKPTVAGDGVSVETWLDGFAGDLYGKELIIDFYAYLRPERKFDSLDALREEIFRNQAQARSFFAADAV